MALTTHTPFDTRIFVEMDGTKVTLNRQSTYPGSDAVRLATIVEIKGKLTLVLEQGTELQIARAGEPVIEKVTATDADEIPF